ncbi:MAG TPA: ATP-binding protein [Gemmataceae bacterium]|nr:ATP-binding protein [Gemmataceae bacterium]
MSYRAFKRLLGENSLERKCRFVLGTVSVVLITASFWIYARQTEDIAYRQTANSGRLLVPFIFSSLHPQAAEIKKAMEEFQARAEKNWSQAWSKYEFGVIKPNSHNPANRPEPDEVGLLDKFLHDPEYKEASRQTPSGDSFFYYSPMRASPVCMGCHPTNAAEKVQFGNLKDGDLMAVIRIKLSGEALQQEFHLNRALLISFAIATSLLIMTMSYLMIRYVIVKPVKHLKDVSDAIAAGELNVRSEIQTGDEFEDLSYAFNRMLRNLMSMQEQLKGANVELDRKVDELARTNLALYESNRLKSDFLATMSHELRTPLNSVLGFSDLLLANPQLPEKMRRWAGNILSSGKQLLALINDLLDLAKIEAGKMEVNPEAVSIADLADGLMTMHRPLAEKKNIDLRALMDPDLRPARQDRGKLQQILSNLLSNAIKFTPEGGRVQLRAEVDGNDLVLTVADTGVGIAPDDQDLVFEKFRQAASPMTREHEGTGLGLSIVRELSKLLGGDVTLESEVGRGSTFTVRLPLELKEPPRIIFEPSHLADGPDLPRAAVVG